MDPKKNSASGLRDIPVGDLRAGISFSEAVYIDDENLFVPANVSIKQKDLDKLAPLGIETVYTAGRPVGTTLHRASKPDLSDGYGETAADKNAPAHSFPTIQKNKAAYRVYRTLIDRINELFIRISGGRAIDNRVVNSISTQLLQALRTQREQFMGFILGGEVKGAEMAKSAANIAILSGLTAQELRLPSHRTLYVIIGALLHDAGMFRLPRKILEKKDDLTHEERRQMRSHPLLSKEIVIRGLSYPEEIGDIVLQHHERWDGTGYPHRLPGNGITIGARIVSIADSFEAMVSHKPYRDSLVGYEANRNLMADNSRRFDPDVLRVFILTMGIYPIGSIVRLNNGAIARISEVRAGTPLRPKVQVLVDEHKKARAAAEDIFIDLLTEKRLFIAKAIGFQEFAEMHARD